MIRKKEYNKKGITKVPAVSLTIIVNQYKNIYILRLGDPFNYNLLKKAAAMWGIVIDDMDAMHCIALQLY